MSKFNSRSAGLVAEPNTTNLAGGQAYSQSAKSELVSHLLTSMVQDQYYRSADEGLDRLRALIQQVDPIFAAKAAIYARNEAGMRSVSHVVAAEIARLVKGQTWTKDFYNAVVRRPDDITEILAYYIDRYDNRIPNALKKGLGASFEKFDRYQLAKYRGEKNSVSLVDAVNLTHPRPSLKNADAIRDLVKGDLRQEGTWESELSSGKDKAQVWQSLLAENKLGYLALLKNLRNIAEQAPGSVDLAIERLTDPEAIRRSLVLPFRFAIAIEQLREYPKYQLALSQALDISVANIPEFENALVIIDVSGSMGSPVAGNKDLACVKLGSIFGAALARKSGADVIAFGSSAEYVNIRPQDSVLTNAEGIPRIADRVGHGTNFHSAFQLATSSKRKYDNIILFSDMQAWQRSYYGTGNVVKTSFAEYKKATGANPNVFSFDLAGYGTLQFPENKVYALAGFSNKVFDIMEGLKSGDRDVMVKTIEAISF